MTLPLREVFKALGFDEFHNPLADVSPSFSTRIGGHRVTFDQFTSQYLAPVFSVSGIVTKVRSIGFIQLDIPIEVADFEQGVAWIAYAMRGMFDDDDKPPWLRDGEQWQHTLPWQREAARYAALRAARPHCTVARDWFRLAANDLSARAVGAGSTEVADVMFDGETLTIRAGGRLLTMAGTGDAWPQPANVSFAALTRLKKRLMHDPVTIDIWEGRLGVDRDAFNLVTPSGKKLPYATIAWTPPGSQRGLGTILLKAQPHEVLTPQAYRFALQSRLENLIEATGDDAPWMLKAVEANEPGLSVSGSPAQIAELLVENSSWLCERAGIPATPVLAPLPNDPDALAHLQSDDDTLEAYLNALYYDGGGE